MEPESCNSMNLLYTRKLEQDPPPPPPGQVVNYDGGEWMVQGGFGSRQVALRILEQQSFSSYFFVVIPTRVWRTRLSNLCVMWPSVLPSHISHE